MGETLEITRGYSREQYITEQNSRSLDCNAWQQGYFSGQKCSSSKPLIT